LSWPSSPSNRLPTYSPKTNKRMIRRLIKWFDAFNLTI
jgi:hypothetical protein